MSLFTPSRPPVLGLDISSTSVKLLELARKGSQLRLASYAIEPLPQGAVVEDEIREVEVVGEAIKRAFKRTKSKLKTVAVAVPSSAVITKVISMPASLTEDDMETQIRLEADQYIPYPLEEVNLDFEVQGPSAKSDEMVDVLLAASRTENVEMRIAAVDYAGLVAKVVDVESYAMENACVLLAHQMPDEGRDKTVAVVDIGSRKSTLHVIHDNRTIYNRDQLFGGNQLTEEIMNRYGLPYEDAVRAKRQGDLPDDYQGEVLRPFLDLMGQHVLNAVNFFYSSSEFNQLDFIVLAGGSAAVPGAKELVQARVRTTTVIANPFAGMALASGVTKLALSADAPGLMIACGLALRSFD